MLCAADARSLVASAPCKASSAKFLLRPTAETLADLSPPIDPRPLKTRNQRATTHFVVERQRKILIDYEVCNLKWSSPKVFQGTEAVAGPPVDAVVYAALLHVFS